MTIEAMKLALEALTRIWEDGLENFPESGHDAAITALRTAIEQAYKQEPVAWMHNSGHIQWRNPNWDQVMASGYTREKGWSPLYTTPPAAQPAQQEPVATKLETQQFNCFHVSAEDFQRLKALPVGTKLYTTPPAQEFVCSTGLCHYKAQRQPLTDEKINEIAAQGGYSRWVEFARAIEAAHGIGGKNT